MGQKIIKKITAWKGWKLEKVANIYVGSWDQYIEWEKNQRKIKKKRVLIGPKKVAKISILPSDF